MDEYAILSRYAVEGGTAGFDELVRRYEPLVRAAALRQVRDPYLAGDITQATMMTLMRKAGKIRRRQPLGPWLLRVTHYLAVDALRNNSMRRRHERSAARLRHECQESGSPWRSIAPILDSALHALGNGDRTILTLRYLQDWSTEQIAGELRVSSMVVRQRLSRALRRLRKVLAERGIEREELIPILPPLLIRLRQRLGMWNPLPLRAGGKNSSGLSHFLPRPVLRERAGVRAFDLQLKKTPLTLTLSRSTGRGDKKFFSPALTSVAAGVAAAVILGGGWVLTRAEMRKAPVAASNNSASALIQPGASRAKSTIP